MTAKKHWFIFHNGAIILKREGKKLLIPHSLRAPVKHTAPVREIYKNAFAAELAAVPKLPTGLELVDLRESHSFLSEKMFFAAGRAAQILRFFKESKFCPVCGAATKDLAYNSKVCPSCKKELYPVINSASMVLVTKGKEILMVRGRNFRGPFYGLVAGFLEAGETLEECAKREVLEETNLKIKNIKYFGSQPWPFPGGLMVGFTADYAGGKLKIEEKELLTAQFFSKQNLPLLPGRVSLARRMVDAWLKTQ